MLSITIAGLAIVAAAYLIIKKYYAPGALLMVGLITLGIVACISPEPLITGKKATHLAGLDVIQIFTNLLQTRTGGLGMNIMAIAGFTYYMDKIGASGALVRLSVKPLKLIHSPYLIMTLGFVIGLVLNIFIPSAVGLALLLMVSLYPVLVMGGISRQSAAATILVGGCCCFGPSGSNNLLAADLTKMHVMDFFLNVQWSIGWVAVIGMLIAHFFVQRWFDKRDLASGKLTKADFEVPALTKEDEKAINAPVWYALFPLFPVALLFTFSPLVYKGIRMEVVTALILSTLVALVLDGLRRRNLKETVGSLKTFAEGMGKVFTSTVFLIVCAEVFAAALSKSGGIRELINLASGFQGGGVPVFTVMYMVVVGSAFVMGSGNAAFFSFAPMIPEIASKVGLNAAYMISPLQLGSGMARSSSPIAGVTIAIAGLSGLNPFDLIRRSIPPMVVGIIIVYLRSLMLL